MFNDRIGEKVDANDVRRLRELTNCGLMECKKALLATDNEFLKAIEWLKANASDGIIRDRW